MKPEEMNGDKWFVTEECIPGNKYIGDFIATKGEDGAGTTVKWLGPGYAQLCKYWQPNKDVCPTCGRYR